MTTLNLQKEWKSIVKEVHDKPKCATPYPKDVAQMRDLLLFAQVFLGKIGNNENVPFNTIVYQKIMAEYYRQKLSLEILTYEL